VSSLWTPGGEHPVDKDDPQSAADTGDGPAPTGPQTMEEALADLDPEERAQAEQVLRQMAEVQRQLLEAPPETVVANHAMGLYELAAIHLSQPDPDFDAAKLAIDGMAGLVENLGERLGDVETTLRDALQQIQLAFVQVKEKAATGAEE